MKIISREEYFSFYEKYGRCIDQIHRPNSKLSTSKLESKYNNYVKKEEKKIAKQKLKEINKKKEIKKDEKWEDLRKDIWKRDKGQCQLIRVLTYEEYQELKRNSGGLHKKSLDLAHSIWTRRSKEPKHKYLKEGIVLLNRFSHSMIDQYRNPITGNPISKEEAEEWWKRIFGKTRLDILLNILD